MHHSQGGPKQPQTFLSSRTQPTPPPSAWGRRLPPPATSAGQASPRPQARQQPNAVQPGQAETRRPSHHLPDRQTGGKISEILDGQKGSRAASTSADGAPTSFLALSRVPRSLVNTTLGGWMEPAGRSWQGAEAARRLLPRLKRVTNASSVSPGVPSTHRT